MTPEEQRGAAEAELKQKQVAYMLRFPRDDASARAVLEDLAAFCGAAETPACLGADRKLDLNMTLVMLGRHEVFIRIARFLNLRTDELFQLEYRPKQGVTK